VKVRMEWSAREGALEAALGDERLSFRAKGLLAFLTANPDETYDLQRLVSAASEGRDALRTALEELEHAGLVERHERVDEKAAKKREQKAASRAPIPVMDSLFGPTFAPPIPIDELPSVQEESRTPEEEAVERIIRRLNALREASWDWAHYTPLLARYPKNVEKIKERLREGHTEQELTLVLEYRAAADGGDERSRRYFNSETPFNTRNFDENLALALDWDARGRPTRKGPGAARGTSAEEVEIYERTIRGGRE